MGIKKISIIFCLNIVIIFGLMKINFNVAFAGDEISLYDRKGDAVAYIAVDDELTIYLWKGKPVAYLDGEDVYSIKGANVSDGHKDPRSKSGDESLDNAKPESLEYNQKKGVRNLST